MSAAQQILGLRVLARPGEVVDFELGIPSSGKVERLFVATSAPEAFRVEHLHVLAEAPDAVDILPAPALAMMFLAEPNEPSRVGLVQQPFRALRDDDERGNVRVQLSNVGAKEASVAVAIWAQLDAVAPGGGLS